MTVPHRSPLNLSIDTIADAYTLAVGRWRWRKATDITTLANLQADRLSRIADSLPVDGSDFGRQWMMHSALVALGRLGVVVDAWRPGTAAHGHEHGVVMETRAAVSGFASTEVKVQLDNLLYHAGLKSFGDDAVIYFTVKNLWGPGGDSDYKKFDGADSARWEGQPVERMDGTPTSWIGGSTDARQIYRAFPTRRSVQEELREAWLITIADRQWGASTLFADLLELLAKNGQDTTV